MGARPAVDMTKSKRDRCRTCRADVIFVPSATSGKPMILDAKPKKGVVLVHPTLFHELHLGATTVAAARVVDVYADHHGTCPGAKAWAGRNRKNPPTDVPPYPGDGEVQ